MTGDRPIRRALVSVFDKAGVIDFARGLAACDVEIVSTGGTAKLLAETGITVREVRAATGAPEMLAGRVKTLHPKIHGGILARRGRDEAELAAHGIEPIDLVVTNLYPFEATAARADASLADIVEKIDIGGPAMIRAAAKNWFDVTVVCDPADYAEVLAAIEREGGLSETARHRLAAKAFRRTAAYDAAIALWFAAGVGAGDEEEARFPDTFTPRFERRAVLRYGENPHQRAALYAELGAGAGTVVGARQLQGKPLSFNNLADADAAYVLACAFERPACAIVKHANPCGVALAATIEEAYRQAFACDPASAFGGIVAFNRPLDATAARAILDNQFAEVIVAPEVTDDALRVTAAKQNLRVLAVGGGGYACSHDDYRRLAGGLLVQDADAIRPLAANAEAVTRRVPNEAERTALDFAWRVVQTVRSNAIVVAREDATLGIGAGQMSRVDAVRLAGTKAAAAGHSLTGGVLASDAFFPFRDNVDEAARLGVRAIVQPGGSRRDAEVIAAADEHDIAMVLTGERHFRH
ncbi:MAG: bifunctional phosphoribosylaminoimidazolecarboxamide formyltransferase/IMP cyclohydrolase [Gammaproteobacteria bacterium]